LSGCGIREIHELSGVGQHKESSTKPPVVVGLELKTGGQFALDAEGCDDRIRSIELIIHIIVEDRIRRNRRDERRRHHRNWRRINGIEPRLINQIVLRGVSKCPKIRGKRPAECVVSLILKGYDVVYDCIVKNDRAASPNDGLPIAKNPTQESAVGGWIPSESYPRREIMIFRIVKRWRMVRLSGE